jgi:hypothetical protein
MDFSNLRPSQTEILFRLYARSPPGGEMIPMRRSSNSGADRLFIHRERQTNSIDDSVSAFVPAPTPNATSSSHPFQTRCSPPLDGDEVV